MFRWCGLWIGFVSPESPPDEELVTSLSVAVGAYRENLLAFLMARVEIAESL